jgi:L-fuconolactonase
MKRRTLLNLLGSGLLPAAPARGIIDSHVHFYDPTRPEGVPWPASKTDPLYRPTLPGPWAEMVRPLNVTGVVVVEASPWLEDNQWVLDLAKENPVIVGFVGHLEPGKPDFRAHLARFHRDPLFRGIRLGETLIHAALEDPAAMDDLRRLADAGLALDTIGNGPMLLDVAKLSDRIPDLRIVVDHLPFESPSGSIQALQARSKVYAKVSGVLRRVEGRVPDDGAFYRDSLDELWKVFGPDRVIYASNWPVCERIAPYATVLKVVREYFEAKGSVVAEKYFRTNSAAAYGWVTRASL